jgi:hypothetical protein
MRRLTAWIAGVAGGIAAYRFFRRHPQPEPAPSPEPADADARADELRAKLAESRTAEPVVEEAPPEPVAEEEPAAEPESPEERRRRVHEEGRAALDEMHSDD